jgi:hypothetical protein
MALMKSAEGRAATASGCPSRRTTNSPPLKSRPAPADPFLSSSTSLAAPDSMNTSLPSAPARSTPVAPAVLNRASGRV